MGFKGHWMIFSKTRIKNSEEKPRLCAMHKSRVRLVRLLRKLSNAASHSCTSNK
jgi:hypothetical protein